MAKTLIRHFESLPDFGRDCASANVGGERAYHSSSWNGGTTIGKAQEMALSGGDVRLVERAEELVKQFQDSVDVSLLQPRWTLAPVGAFPSVPDFLAGSPECMYRRVQDESERAPLTIWVCVTSSGGIEAEELLARGTAITALFMALSATRPVSLRAFSGLSGKDHRRGNYLVTVALPQPIALSEAAFCLSNSAFSRGLTYGWLETVLGAGGGWPEDVHHGKFEARIECWRKLLGASETDLIFPHSFMDDPDLSDPVGFAKSIIKRYTHEEND